jgi:hypothetical protein
MCFIGGRTITGLTLSFVAFLCGCERPSQSAVTTPDVVAPPASSTPHQRDADDVARFIAGVPGAQGSPFAELESSDAWKDHRRRLDSTWNIAENKLIRNLREFQRKELGSPAVQSAPVFYPFGGPDALTATLCFPESPRYVMVGLEPSGTLPSPEQILHKDLPAYLAEMRNTVASELGRSFFVTRQMDQQFRGQVTDGVLLPILHLLVRTDHTVLGFRYVRLDDDGQIVEREPTYHAPTRFGNKGVEVEFRSNSDHSIHKLYYFTVNLSDARLAENRPFLTYIEHLKGSTTLLKATSYMTHRRDFSMIRDQILAASAHILQDDSGLPFRYFHEDAWKVQLYGDYEKPYGSFRWLEQKDLRKAYEEAEVKPLSLHIGYGYQRITSNLLYATRVHPPPVSGSSGGPRDTGN